MAGTTWPEGAEGWVRERVGVVGPVEVVRERAWATVWRVPVTGGFVFFKVCGAVQAFEPYLTAQLAGRWPGRVAEVLGHDEERGWLLLADAGTAVAEFGNPPRAWVDALPGYAELQRGEAARVGEYLAHGVPDLRVAALPERYEQLLRRELPLGAEEVGRLRGFAVRFGELCAELAAAGVPDSIQHDDLHMRSLYRRDGRGRVLDWGDASVSHPFASLVVTFRFLETFNGLRPGDPWFGRLRDAYLEPWGSAGGGLEEVFALAVRLGTFAHACAWARQRDALPPPDRAGFDEGFAVELRRAVVRTAR